MLQRGLQRLQVVAEGLVGLVDGLKLHLAAVLMQVLAEDERMIALLLRLNLVPMGETLQALFLIVIGERQVQVRRIQLLANLVVNQLVHLCIHCESSFGDKAGRRRVSNTLIVAPQCKHLHIPIAWRGKARGAWAGCAKETPRQPERHRRERHEGGVPMTHQAAAPAVLR